MKHTIHNVQREVFGAVHIEPKGQTLTRGLNIDPLTMFVLAVSAETKATQQFLKGESRGKFSRAFFSTDNEDRLCKGVLNIPPLQCLSAFIFHSINSLLINHLIINLQAIAGSDCWTQCWTPC